MLSGQRVARCGEGHLCWGTACPGHGAGPSRGAPHSRPAEAFPPGPARGQDAAGGWPLPLAEVTALAPTGQASRPPKQEGAWADIFRPDLHLRCQPDVTKWHLPGPLWPQRTQEAACHLSPWAAQAKLAQSSNCLPPARAARTGHSGRAVPPRTFKTSLDCGLVMGLKTGV